MAPRTLLYATIVVLLTLAFCGCGDSRKADTSKKQDAAISKSPAEREKADLLRSLERRFEDPETHIELARLYQNDGLWAKAEYHYNVAMSFDPAARDAQAGMVKVLEAAGDTAKSVLTADIYIGQVSSSAAQSLRLGLAFQKQYMDEYAMQCYQQALRLAPNSAKINRQIGYYHLSKGNIDQAKDYLSRSFQLDPTQAEVAGELGRLGVAVQIPRKTQRSTGKLDKIVEESERD
jgi:tetratricopeptide (TPR) repeat protein